MSMKRMMRFFSGLAPWLIIKTYKMLTALLIATCRFQIDGLSNFISTAKNGKCILILWHDRLSIIPTILNKFAPQLRYIAVVSNSRDGKILAQLATSYHQCDTILVSQHSREIALKRMVEALDDDQGVLIVTPDGPRGPKHRLKPGVAMAAAHTGASIVPVTWESSKTWQINTWDKMEFPKPFSKMILRFGSAFILDTEAEIDKAVEQLENALNA